MNINWQEIFDRVSQDMTASFLQVFPKIVIAIIVFTIGWLLAVAVGRLITEVLNRINFNQLFQRGDWKGALERADIKMDPARFVGSLFKWMIGLVVLLMAVDILGLEGFEMFLQDVVGYLPNVIAAALILVVAVVISDVVEKIVRFAMESMRLTHGQLIGSIAKWIILIFAFLSALLQLHIAVLPIEILIQTFVQALGYGLALAFALAFGLGGRDI
ncbi:MAG: hypothetical protein A3E07_03410, partial [Candidatus Wildermuthbacteria bacterium RIFCSPHIGHO2_12_FULL_45_9]